MYNTQFKVKYNDIEEELLHKLQVKTHQEYNSNSDETYEYSNQDVVDICHKLYRDELLSVFEAENLFDGKIDKGMIYVYDIMITNQKFKETINEITDFSSNQFIKNEKITSKKQESLRQLILYTLFSQQLFHITHQCVCQQINVGTIDSDLLVELRKHSIDLLKNKFGVN